MKRLFFEQIRIGRAPLFLLAAVWICFDSGASAAEPTRIVSLNLCTDSILFELVERSRIASITHLSLDPQLSYFVEQARGIHINHGLAEEILPLEADLILAGSQTAQPTTHLLESIGVSLVVVDPAESLSDYRANLRRIAAAVNKVERAEKLLERMDARIAAALTGVPRARPRAIVLHASGFIVGARTLVTDILNGAGFDNLAHELRMPASGFVPMEILILSDPDLIVFADPQPTYPSLANEFLRHRGFDQLVSNAIGGRSRGSIDMSAKYWTCGGSFAAEAVELLAATHEGVLSAGGGQ